MNATARKPLSLTAALLVFLASQAHTADDPALDKLRRNGQTFEKILAHENPIVAALAVREAQASWKAAYKQPLLKLLSHDDESLRGQAARALAEKAGSFAESELKKLLRDADPHRQAEAMFLAAYTLRERAVGELKPYLRDGSQLLRTAAITQLWRIGSAGRALVLDHSTQEKQPYLRQLIASFARREGDGVAPAESELEEEDPDGE